ncbi:uncharacterized protein F5891DRAFT_1186228 [Suillus fuscotomentosus]|uniref:MARVEL domain-containing protein n=1 Tax=Suillus fuscotomentosus TaxID=1912939 RepID=A0AAD4HPB0_9AGAM|nr:uncharacterized protein F5891DRAFT_1186228 [Suillus fuscotomentosus]KAG1902579.1 hypothetical protein F5891DRAFT_1186228 [Suillus fuscotomentosus]
MVIKIVRWCVLTFTLIFAIVVLGISGHLLAIRHTHYWHFAALAVAVSSLTILTFPVILLVNTLLGSEDRTSTERIFGEALWLSIMWILWLATGANATHAARVHFFSGGCSFFSGFSNKICNEFRVVEAFAYINFIILLCYTIGLFAYEFTRDRSQVGHVQTSEVQAPNTSGQ